MPDREIESVSMLIDECELGARFYLVFAFALILAGVSSFVWLLTHSMVDKVFLGATGGILSLFGGIPAHLFFAARNQAIYLGSLRASWQDAQKENDVPAMQQLKDEWIELRKGTLSKPFWSLR